MGKCVNSKKPKALRAGPYRHNKGVPPSKPKRKKSARYKTKKSNSSCLRFVFGFLNNLISLKIECSRSNYTYSSDETRGDNYKHNCLHNLENMIAGLILQVLSSYVGTALFELTKIVVAILVVNTTT